MAFSANKTKIVCTVGPASESPEILAQMMQAGMNIVRLNFSHGDFESHKRMIDRIRAVAQETGRRVAIMGDLPGPKMRIGQLDPEPIKLQAGDTFTLTTDDIAGTAERVSVSFKRLPRVVSPGNRLFLNDGIIQVEVTAVQGRDVSCTVLVGGELRSRKGLNLPGIDLGISAFTDHDRECLAFAMQNGVDAVSQSFVENAQDIDAVRAAARELGHDPFIIAKIERSGARRHMADILKAADGIMIARGDLGVEIPIEEIAVAQKGIMNMANIMGKPVITATQMLESMTTNPRPTRAEATDVANAILDGTDCVMLSGESAMGDYPVEAVAMLAKIAAAIEPHRPPYPIEQTLQILRDKDDIAVEDLISLSVETVLKRVTPPTVIVPTRSGATARTITRFRLPIWITAVSAVPKTCQDLTFSYGVRAVLEPHHPENWRAWSRQWLASNDLEGDFVILTEGPSATRPDRNNRMEIVDLRRD